MADQERDVAAPPKRTDHTTDFCEELTCAVELKFCTVDGGRNWSDAAWYRGERRECNEPLVDFPHAEIMWSFIDGIVTTAPE